MERPFFFRWNGFDSGAGLLGGTLKKSSGGDSRMSMLEMEAQNDMFGSLRLDIILVCDLPPVARGHVECLFTPEDIEEDSILQIIGRRIYQSFHSNWIEEPWNVVDISLGTSTGPEMAIHIETHSAVLSGTRRVTRNTETDTLPYQHVGFLSASLEL